MEGIIDMSGIFLFKMMFDRQSKKKKNEYLHPCPDDINKRANYSIRLRRYIGSFFHIMDGGKKGPDDNRG